MGDTPKPMGFAGAFAGKVRRRLELVRAALPVARHLDQRLAFVVREARRSRETAEYTSRGKRVRITHGSLDAWVFREVFDYGLYDVPTGAPAPRRIVDLGGNIGMFTLLAASKWPNAEIVAFEPDPVNAAKYRWTIENNAIRATLVEACAGVKPGSVAFWTGMEARGRMSDDGSGDQLPVVDVFPYLQDADLIKIDIEGSEWAILLDERFRTVPAHTVMLEYHGHLCPEPSRSREVAEAALRAAGYEPEHVADMGKNGVGTLRAFRVQPPAGERHDSRDRAASAVTEQ